MITSSPVLHAILGEIALPGDKSITHRALILAAIATGVTHINNALDSDDCVATARALQQMGVRIEWLKDKVIVHGVGRNGLNAPVKYIDCGNSGTSMRLLSGLLVGQAFDSVLIGDESLSKRPMMRIVTPLRQMGANIHVDDGCAPIYIQGQSKPSQTLKAIVYQSPVASAQVKTCVLLAGLYAKGHTEVLEPVITRDHTERLLPFFSKSLCETRVLDVPGDLSSAAFFMVLASLVPGSVLRLRGIGVNPTRMGMIDILKAMGADIKLTNFCFYGAEPVADIKIAYAKLKGIEIGHTMLVRAIDEFPILLIAAAEALGETRILGVSELRHKESDRVAVMVKNLNTLGIAAVVDGNDVKIQGGVLQGGTVDAVLDHRIAMAFLIAGTVAKAPIQVLNTDAISTSFPAFVQMAKQLGCLINE